MKLDSCSIYEVTLNENDVRSYGREVDIEIRVPLLLLEEHLFHKGTCNLEYGLGMLDNCLVSSLLDKLIFDLLLSKFGQDSCQDLFHC